MDSKAVKQYLDLVSQIKSLELAKNEARTKLIQLAGDTGKFDDGKFWVSINHATR